ncbi:MAG TPA: hypothetical protein DDX92_09510 [Flavobacteriales bacterium]|jgi:peptidoglycan-associated lipoprotein|nr:hypothetical protein [Flavobacteriales bacterium]
MRNWNIKPQGWLILGLLFSISTSSFAQKNFMKEADAAYDNLSYYHAIELYKKAYSKTNKKEEKKRILYQIGKSYYDLQDETNAEEWLSKAIKAGYDNPDAQLQYAKTIMRKGEYDRAIAEFNKYKGMNPNDPEVDVLIKSCERAQEWKDNPTRYKVEPEPIINSKQSDFSPTWSDKKNMAMVFTSTREGALGNATDEVTGQNFSSIWFAEQDKKSRKFNTPTLVDDGVVNTGTSNEGGVTFDERKNNMYFTRCMSEKKKVLGCKIYTSRKMGNAWGEPAEVKLVESDTTVAGHPSVGLDDEYLFFASDMPGGYGGKDIWMSKWEKKGRTWGKPVNLGKPINTSGDEMFPYIHEDGRLFFASNGHEGMGGLDIYMSERQGEADRWGNVQNMRYPINSSYNDFAILFDGKEDRGYFTTDRPGGRGMDDIWMFSIPPLRFIIAGNVSDVDSGEPLSGATVRLVGTDGSQVEQTVDELGYYEFNEKEGGGRYILEETSYTLEVTMPQYLVGKGQETTVGLEESTKLVHDFKLQSIKKKEIVFPEVRYDFARWELQVNDSVNSKDSLDFLYQVLIDNPTIVIELMAHTDQRGNDDFNLELSDKRANSCVEYLASKGIPGERMEARGYGESDPVIGESVILELPTEEEREAAYQKNRRTTFRVLRDDYVPAPQEEETPEDEE